MRIWNNLSFGIKAGVLVVVLLSFAVITAARYQLLVDKMKDQSVAQSNEILLKAHQAELKHIVDMTAQTLEAAIDGIEDEEQIRAIFKKLLQNALYLPDKSGYIFVFKKGGLNFVHPTQPNLEGKDISDLQDPNGKYLIKELEKAALAGGGYVNYLWEKPEHGVQPKLSYSRTIDGDRYWLGTGYYIDDIQKEEQAILKRTNTLTQEFLHSLYLIVGIIGLLVALPLTIVVISSIVKPVRELTAAADSYSRGNMDIEIPYTDRTDEIGKLAMALKRLGMSVKVAMASLKK